MMAGKSKIEACPPPARHCQRCRHISSMLSQALAGGSRAPFGLSSGSKTGEAGGHLGGWVFTPHHSAEKIGQPLTLDKKRDEVEVLLTG